MSWEKPILSGGMSQYNPVQQGMTHSAAESAGKWIIDQLREHYPTHRTIAGDVPIGYEWFFDLSPKTTITLPTVAIGVMTAEHLRLGSAMQDDHGTVVPGELFDSVIVIVVLANNSPMRDGIEHRLARKLLRIINFTKGTPFRYGSKRDFGDDRGFSSIDRFVISSLWQNLTDEAFVKVTTFTTGWVEDFVEPEDDYWLGVAGVLAVDVSPSPPSNRSLGFSLILSDTVGQSSVASQSRIEVNDNELSLVSNTRLYFGTYVVQSLSSSRTKVISNALDSNSNTTIV
jgi:hypothetical protein